MFGSTSLLFHPGQHNINNNYKAKVNPFTFIYMVIAVFLKFRDDISSQPRSILSICHGENVPHAKISHEELIVAHTCDLIEE